MQRVRNSSWNPTLFVLPNKNYLIWERGRERDIEKKGTDEIPYTNLCCVILLCLVLLCASLFFSSFYLCYVCNCSLFVFPLLPFFFLLFFFSCAWLSLFIEKFQRNCSLIFLSTNQLMEQFASIFLSTTTNFVFSRAHYSTFCSFYSFHPILNSLFSTGDISTFQLFRLTFLIF